MQMGRFPILAPRSTLAGRRLADHSLLRRRKSAGPRPAPFPAPWPPAGSVRDVAIAHGGVDDSLRQLLCACAALGVSVALDGGGGSGLQRDVPDRRKFLSAVGAETVDGDDAGQTETGYDANVVGQLGPPRMTLSTSGLSRSRRGILPCHFRARAEATSTAALGNRPLVRVLMCMNFSKPRSDANPASVIT